MKFKRKNAEFHAEVADQLTERYFSLDKQAIASEDANLQKLSKSVPFLFPWAYIASRVRALPGHQL